MDGLFPIRREETDRRRIPSDRRVPDALDRIWCPSAQLQAKLSDRYVSVAARALMDRRIGSVAARDDGIGAAGGPRTSIGARTRGDGCAGS